MLENIRKYTGLMVVVLILLFVGLVFLTDTSSTSSLGGGPAIAKMEGREFTQKDFNHASSNLELTMRLNTAQIQGQTLSLGPSWAAEFLVTGYYEDPNIDFMINRAILREQADQLGIYPSTEAVQEHIKTLPYFGGFIGDFDSAKFERFKTKSLGRFSLTNADFTELMKDELRFRQIFDLVAGELPIEPSMATRIADQNLQILDLSYTLINRSKFEESLEVSEEDIKAFWEENKDRYLTDEQRKVEWLKIALKEEAKLPPLEKEQALPEGATEEQKKEAAAKRSALLAERAADQEDLENLVFFAGENLVLEQIINEQEGEEFLASANSGIKLVNELLKDQDFEDADLSREDLNKLNITTGITEFFTPNNPPAELNLSLKQAPALGGGSNTPVDAIFTTNINGDEADRISNLLVLADGSAIAFKVTDMVAAEPLPYAQARSQARADLRSNRLDEAVDEATEKLIASLKEGLAADKDAKTIIEAAGFEHKEAMAVDPSKPAPGLPNFRNIYREAVVTNPNEVGKAVEQSVTLDAKGQSVSEGKVVFVVEDRRISEGPETDRNRESSTARNAGFARELLFREWIRSKQQEAQVEIIAEVK